MSRFTKELGPDNTYDMPANNLTKALNKFGKLEDEEEKFGVDLLLLLEAMSSGIYYLSSDGVIRYVRQSEFWLSNNHFGYGFVYDVRFIYLHDYGKKVPGGWALAKEELL